LVPFPNSKKTSENDVRDLALAWQSIVNSGMTMAQPEAEQLLKQALVQYPDDPAVLAALGYIEQKQGAKDKARDHYRKALAEDPMLIDAETNLGVLEARSGQLKEAVSLWQDAFRRAPGRSEIGMNLARAFCSTRQFNEARNYTMRVLHFNPDLGYAKAMLKQLNADPPGCGN
jgi:Flp pilus assembly protein TadD